MNSGNAKKVNSNEHMAMMRSRITSGTHSAENKLRNVRRKIQKIREKLRLLEETEQKLEAVIERRGQAKLNRGADDNVELVLQQLVQALLAANKNMG